jgi:hypothetical protein
MFQGIEQGDVGLYGEEVVVGVIAGGERGGFCGCVGHWFNS